MIPEQQFYEEVLDNLIYITDCTGYFNNEQKRKATALIAELMDLRKDTGDE